MRILYTHTSSLIGGGNRVMLSLLEGLDRSRYEPFSVIPEPGPLEEELHRRHVPYIILDLRPTPRSRLATIATIVRLASRAIRQRVDVLHANDPLTYRLASVAVRACHAVRICHLHHPEQDANSLRWAFSIRPHGVLTPTGYVRDRVCEWLSAPDASFVHTVGNPVDIDWFSPAIDVPALRQRLQMDVEGPHISVLGALAPHKGHECFLHMAVLVRRAFPTATFHVMGSAQTGDRGWAQHLRELADKLGIERSVRFWGFVPDPIARDVLRASDLFVLPTRVEGFCLVLAEALACGVPVLASAIRPLDEVVSNGRTGWLIPPNDVAQFAERAVELLSLPEKYRQFSVTGRESIIARFSHTAFAARVMTYYDESLRRAKKSDLVEGEAP